MERAMGVLEPVGATMVIMQEAIKLLPRNGKLIALTVVATLLLTSLFTLVFNYSVQSLFRDMLMRESFIPFTSPQSDEFTKALTRLKEDVGFMFLIELAFILAYWFISVFSITASILFSAISNSHGTLTCKDFALLVIRTSKRPLLTGFYTTLLGTGYLFFVVAMASPLFVFSNFGLGYVPWSIIWYGIFAYVLYLYFAVVWILSVVVSVVEENCYGIEALGKAGGLIKGKRVQGFILSATFSVISLVLVQGFRIIRGHKWLENDTLFLLVVLNLSTLMKLFQYVSYTVLYFHCKKHHGEEIIELQGGAAEFYTKISTAPFVDDDMA